MLFTKKKSYNSNFAFGRNNVDKIHTLGEDHLYKFLKEDKKKIKQRKTDCQYLVYHHRIYTHH